MQPPFFSPRSASYPLIFADGGQSVTRVDMAEMHTTPAQPGYRGGVTAVDQVSCCDQNPIQVTNFLLRVLIYSPMRHGAATSPFIMYPSHDRGGWREEVPAFPRRRMPCTVAVNYTTHPPPSRCCWVLAVCAVAGAHPDAGRATTSRASQRIRSPVPHCVACSWKTHTPKVMRK
jgi:hypothetical protein